MGKGDVSCCLFCATPTSSSRFVFGKPNSRIQAQLEITVILREILEMGEGKLNEFNGKLQSEGGIQACGSCGEAVNRCVEAVQEIAKLVERVSSISASLRDQIFKTWMDEGQGSGSTWGQIRLEVLGAANFGGQGRSDENQGTAERAGKSEAEEEASITDSDIPAVNFIEIVAEEFDERANTAKSILKDPPSEEEDNELLVVLNTEEPSTPSSSAVPPLGPNIYVSVPLCFSDSNTNHQLEKSKEVEVPAPTLKEDQAAPKPKLKKYVCKTCKRSYDYRKNFKRHVKTNICQRPNLEGVAKVPCKYCGREILNMKEHKKICRKRVGRSSIKVTKTKPDDDDSWKRHLQVKTISDDLTMGENE